MLATMTEPFDSPDYTYEIKWDGYRCLAFLDGSTRLQSRNLKDLTPVFPELTGLHQLIRIPGCVIDGEIVALRSGHPSFPELQKRGQLRNEQQINRAAKTAPVYLVAFDLLYFNYQPMINQPIEARRDLLETHFFDQGPLLLSKYITGSGLKYFQAVSDLNLEGVVAKKKASRYLPGKRSRLWLKFKRKLRGPFIICGYALHTTVRGELRSLILGAYVNHQLKYFGMVGTGFSLDDLPRILAELQGLQTDSCPFTDWPNGLNTIHWVQPRLVCDVEYLELTDDGSLRHPSFKKFRPELHPKDCQFQL